ncbi:hypothetical protein DFH09DRAFT_1330380 [Mycena vulgaris]|nr:hypothetical protein DFH09DRAFT_1330380 [Mycena vulgaris]
MAGFSMNDCVQLLRRQLLVLRPGTYKCAHLLGVLTVPNLTNLALPWYLKVRDDKQFVSFLSRSCLTKLRELSLRGAYHPSSKGLQFIPALAKLEINEIVAGVLEFLYKSASSVPHLERINVHIMDTMDPECDTKMDYGVIVDAITSLKDVALTSVSLT